MNEDGFELLKRKMEEQGCSKQQIESKTVPIVYEIITNNPRTQDLWQSEKRLSRAEYFYNNIHEDYERIIRLIGEQDTKYEQYYESIFAGETPEARDALRIAQMFVQSVDVRTAYDNTAFIVGLSAILTGKKISPINELRKINPKLFENTIYENYPENIDTNLSYDRLIGNNDLVNKVEKIIEGCK